MTKRKLNSMKRQATKHLLIGIGMFTLATIPVVFHWSEDITGSVFCWWLSGVVIYDSIKKLVRYNAQL